MIQTKEAVGGHFTWLGIALIVLGIAAILTPAAAGGAVVVVIGLILLGAGVAAAIRGLQAATGWKKCWAWSSASSLRSPASRSSLTRSSVWVCSRYCWRATSCSTGLARS